MVTRKPVPQDEGLAPSSIPPYPVTPVATDPPPEFRMQDARNALHPADDEPESLNAWSEEGKTEHHGPIEVPQSLRAGPPGYSQYGSQNSSQEMLRPNPLNSNPYRINDGKDSSAAAWGGFAERPAQPTGAPPPPPVPKNTPTPAQQFSKLSVSEPSTNPWQPALNEKAASQKTTPIPSIHRQDSGNEAWSTAPPERGAPPVPEQPVLIDMEDEGNESPAWDEDSIPSPTIQEMPADSAREDRQILADQHVWEDSPGSQPTSTVVIPNPTPEEASQQAEGWNLIDHEPIRDTRHQESGIVGADGIVLERRQSEEQAPTLPPRPSQEIPAQPPRPVIETTQPSTSSIASPATAAARKQKKETYEIKKITWHDVTAEQNPRVSPILVQNANGPCPLLALVNALTLSTPANVETALVDTLRSREQVSLGLLLDAVFDELMSGRRGDAAQELPDVGDLYSFLITLHTGMNVNPRFFPPAPTKSAADPRNSMSHVHPAEREAQTPGTFEDTREMKLYSTFSVPLIHGWLPDRGSPAYLALQRTAQSYEDAQNIFFHEEELEDKLRTEGLSFQEQATLEDIATIKAFFVTAATQLTPFGLDTITASLAPGAVAILFRNDHFSTLYRHPDTLQLLQLVTDMGYAGHEEVVWESLIDVNGENAEFFSGDFRLVGGAAPASPAHSRNQSQSNEGWTTVPIRNQAHHQQSLSTPSNPDPTPQSPHSPNIEQEDHDLALALQLQEEEEERHRNELARRRRETELSQQYIEQQGRDNNVPVNTRGGGGGRGTGRTRGPSGPTRGAPEIRPAIPPRRNGPQGQPIGGRPIDPEAGTDAPPPSYEQAANQAAYVPPANHPAHPNASPNNPRRMSAYSANSASMGRAGGRRSMGPTLIEQIEAGSARRRNTGGSGVDGQQEERGKDCIVM